MKKAKTPFRHLVTTSSPWIRLVVMKFLLRFRQASVCVAYRIRFTMCESVKQTVGEKGEVGDLGPKLSSGRTSSTGHRLSTTSNASNLGSKLSSGCTSSLSFAGTPRVACSTPATDFQNAKTLKSRRNLCRSKILVLHLPSRPL